MLLRVSVNLGPIAPLRFRRWLRVKVSGQGPPKPSPAAEAQRSFGLFRVHLVCLVYVSLGMFRVGFIV